MKSVSDGYGSTQVTFFHWLKTFTLLQKIKERKKLESFHLSLTHSYFQLQRNNKTF